MYKCPNCRESWTENELYEAVDDNEDEVVLIRSIGRCPACFNGLKDVDRDMADAYAEYQEE